MDNYCWIRIGFNSVLWWMSWYTRSRLRQKKPITFQVDLQAEGAYADEEYLKEALSNLIDNAVKYSMDTIDIQITSCLSDSIFRSGCGIMESVFRLRLNGLYLISLNASLPGMRMRRRKYPVSVWDLNLCDECSPGAWRVCQCGEYRREI